MKETQRMLKNKYFQVCENVFISFLYVSRQD